jgi:hypothetical protein
MIKDKIEIIYHEGKICLNVDGAVYPEYSYSDSSLYIEGYKNIWSRPDIVEMIRKKEKELARTYPECFI